MSHDLRVSSLTEIIVYIKGRLARLTLKKLSKLQLCMGYQILKFIAFNSMSLIEKL